MRIALRASCALLFRIGVIAVAVVWIAASRSAAANQPLTGVTQLDTGSGHACAVTGQGGLQCWGRNSYGQLGIGQGGDRTTASDVVGLWTGIAAVATGGEHTCALTVAGGVKCWGDGTQGQLGFVAFGVFTYVPNDVPGLSSGVVAIAAGSAHSCALTNAGGVKCWGNNYYGQLGIGGAGNATDVPTDVVGLMSGVVAISTGYNHTCALTQAGAMKCWGANESGQLGRAGLQTELPGDVVGLSTGVLGIGTGSSHSCAVVSGGGVKCWGANWAGQLGDSTRVDSTAPVDVSGLASGVLSVSPGANHTCARLSGGGAKCWGDNDAGQLGNATTVGSLTPVDVPGLTGVTLIKASIGFTCAIGAGGAATCWGTNAGTGNGVPASFPSAVDVIGLGIMYGIAGGANHTCALTGIGGVKCWGRNDFGALGDGTTIDAFAPVDVVGLGTAATAIRAGGYMSCVITNAGGVKCWGHYPAGATPQLSPVDIPSLGAGVADLQVGAAHACALMSGGGIKCWGNNQYGQLGDGTTASSLAPVDVSGLPASAIAIGVGRFHSCAVTNDGSAWCWGDNSQRQLGDNLGGIRPMPIVINGLGGPVMSIDAGFGHTCVQTAQFSMKCLGQNSSGELGVGTRISSSVPVTVALPTGTLSMSLGDFHSCQIGSGGALRCWGANENGQVGDGTRINKLFPVVVPQPGVTAVSAGEVHTCALDGGGVKCWGANGFGQLGNGLGGYVTTPGPVLVPYCGGFADVQTGTPFCANVAWSRNRMITAGCLPGLYCPEASATRLAIAAFVSRAGAALSQHVLSRQDQPGALNPDVPTVVCATADFSTAGQRRSVYLDGVFASQGTTDMSIVLDFMVSIDGGASWQPIYRDNYYGSVRATYWSNLRPSAAHWLNEESTVRYGIEVSRGLLPGTGTITQSTCNLRVRIDNLNGPLTLQ
jgi:alpha-tubulin suppressor-like RCC1 family protein